MYNNVFFFFLNVGSRKWSILYKILQKLTLLQLPTIYLKSICWIGRSSLWVIHPINSFYNLHVFLNSTLMLYCFSCMIYRNGPITPDKIHHLLD